jgi:hypothetical protein
MAIFSALMNPTQPLGTVVHPGIEYPICLQVHKAVRAMSWIVRFGRLPRHALRLTLGWACALHGRISTRFVPWLPLSPPFRARRLQLPCEDPNSLSVREHLQDVFGDCEFSWILSSPTNKRKCSNVCGWLNGSKTIWRRPHSCCDSRWGIPDGHLRQSLWILDVTATSEKELRKWFLASYAE